MAGHRTRARRAKRRRLAEQAERSAVVAEQEFSDRPWADVDKGKLPRCAFLVVPDPDRRSTWALPFREGTGPTDEDGRFTRCGPVNRGALRAIQAALGGARGARITINAQQRARLNRLLRAARIGEFAREEQSMEQYKPKPGEIFEANYTAFAEASLDTENRVLRGIAFLNERSRNGRVYTDKALESTATKLNGKKAFINHAQGMEMFSGARDIRHVLGWHENGRVDGKTVRSDLHYLSNHSEWFESMVGEMADKVGFSVHGMGKITKEEDSEDETVEDMEQVFSGDLVSEPGSTTTMFESAARTGTQENTEEGQMEDLTTITLDQLRESRPDLVRDVEADIRESQDDEAASAKLLTEVKQLREENTGLKAKVDEHDVKEKIREHNARVEQLLAEAKLPEEVVSETFVDQLRETKDEDAIKALIADRRKLAEQMKPKGVHGSGAQSRIEESRKTETKTEDEWSDDQLADAVKRGF